MYIYILYTHTYTHIITCRSLVIDHLHVLHGNFACNGIHASTIHSSLIVTYGARTYVCMYVCVYVCIYAVSVRIFILQNSRIGTDTHL